MLGHEAVDDAKVMIAKAAEAIAEQWRQIDERTRRSLTPEPDPLDEILEAAGIPRRQTRTLAERDGHNVVTPSTRQVSVGPFVVDTRRASEALRQARDEIAERHRKEDRGDRQAR